MVIKIYSMHKNITAKTYSYKQIAISQFHLEIEKIKNPENHVNPVKQSSSLDFMF